MAKNIYDYRDAEGFLPEGRFDKWCRKNNLRRVSGSIASPRYDGIYASEKRDYDVRIGYDREKYRTRTYLRFYPDGTILYEHADLNRLPTPRQRVSAFRRESNDVKNRGQLLVQLRGRGRWYPVEAVTIERPKLCPTRGCDLDVNVGDR